MSKICTELTLTVCADPDYHYEVRVGSDYALTYAERGLNDKTYITFGSLDEMRAVANAMLKAADFSTTMSKN